MPKILFIQPTQYAENGKLCKQRKINLPGLVFPLLAAYTPANWDVEIVLEVVDNVDFESDADIVAIGTMGHAIFRGIEIATEFRKRGKTVVMGGYMASMVPEQALQYVDSVVVGDAEISYPLMLKDFEDSGRLKPIYNNPVTQLKGLPLPRYELLTKKRIGVMLPVQAGRGCPHTCSFCSIACLYKGRYLFRPVDEVIRDIKAIRALGYKRFYLIDDNIVSNPKYLLELCKQIQPLKMKWASQCALHLAANKELLKAVVDSGCDMMSFGVESTSQAAIDSIDKPWLRADKHEEYISILSQAGIMVSTEMIVGMDGDTEASVRDTFHFIHKNRIPIPRIYVLTPIPGSDLYNRLKEEGRLVTEDLNEYNASTCVHFPDNIAPQKLTEQYWILNKIVFSRYSIFYRTVLNRTLWRNPGMLLFAIGINLHYRSYVMKNVAPNIF